MNRPTGGDFRSDPMPSAEGLGLAKERLAKVTRTALKPFAAELGAQGVQDLYGFWLLWHLEGGFEGMQRLGMSRSTIFRRINAFRRAYGVHPDEFAMPGVSLDLRAYLAGTGRMGESSARRRKK